MALAAIAFFSYPVAIYWIDSKKLRRFPAASIFAPLTCLWIFSHSLRRRRYRTVYDAHQKLGPVIRLAPDLLSFSDAEACKEIYSHQAPVVKAELYSNLGNGVPSMFQIIGKTEHGKRRKMLSHVFSARKIHEKEPRVLELVKTLCRDLEIKSRGEQVAPTDEYPAVNGAFDIRPWMNMFSFDVITAVFWSHSYGFLERGNDRAPAVDLKNKVFEVHAMDAAHSNTNFIVPFAHLPRVWWKLSQILFNNTHGAQSAKNFRSMARFVVVRRIKNPPAEPDLFSSIPLKPSEKHPNTLTSEELLSECSTMLSAGADTTQTSLTNCLYHLLKNSSKLIKLRKALLSSVPPESQPVASYTELQNIPFLKAVLDESFRCSPPLGFGLPRLVTQPGMTIQGHYIPPGVVVSSPLYNIHHDETLFPEQWKFIPERWLEGADPDYTPSTEETENLKAYVQPFSLGGRSCIGRNMAYMDLSIVIAALVMAFDWELRDKNREMEYVEKLVTNPKELWVKAKLRDGMDINSQLKRQASASAPNQAS
ncbi:cytochrome P450 [Talaromyces proteolyticus]|uniref:Cytochrome P450 n=1 Tax=Talaromyces proteolyticus TaxID=1131652 RepID=A0AAD4KTK9_9EURO|nr:cytochrome P450 [Talaromyces proteolyticus]KAH8695630.1 cytochrome P450 [Talaromyces proteolyticus]